MIHNTLGEMKANYCDPYCREITDVSVIETETSNIFEVSERQGNECDTELKLTFQLEGTYWACEGDPFPGLFADPTNESQALGMTGMVLGDTKCQVCPEDSSSGPIAPTSAEFLEAMKPYTTVLNPICELLSAEVVDDGKRT
jgi:hypothetical protein